MTTLLLLDIIPNLGQKFEVISVDWDTAMTLMSQRRALVLTPSVRKRFAGKIVEAASPSAQPAVS